MARPLSTAARQKALDATQRLVGAGGIGCFSMDAVARESGVAKTTLYRHWRSGNELLVDAIDCQIETLPTPDTGSLRGDILELAMMFMTVANSPGTRQLMLDLLGTAAQDPELAAVQQAMVHERTRPIREVVQRAVDRGEIPPIDLDLATVFVEGPLVARMLKSSETITRPEIVELVTLSGRGLGLNDLGETDV